MRYAERLSELAARRGGLPRGARFVVLRCSGCDTDYLFDETHAELYLHPENLQSRVAASDEAFCRGCGEPLWELAELTPEQEADLEVGPWGFCFWSSPVNNTAPTTIPRRVLRGAGLVAVIGLALLGAAAVMVNPDPLTPHDRARPHLDQR